ncbi:glyoxalase [Paenibacillus mesophilus]|uniref:DinB family protein n=1 Tax=Paenibacillus mesophilus TaxID=2582849 RepID=UPI00110F2CE1|nr:DinB family protein [Paenibacillus mesophilus]TMV51641.1 glyoxalase [Paenibacillus mesophilus]
MCGEATDRSDRKAKIALEVDGLAAAGKFYCGVLGWNRLEPEAYDIADKYVWLQMPDEEPALLYERGMSEEAIGCMIKSEFSRIKPGDRFYIRVPEEAGSLDPLLRRAESAGAVQNDELEPLCWRTLTLRTPDGYTVVYWQEFEAADEDILALYASGPDRLEAALAGLDEEDLDMAIAPGKWTIRQQVLHVVDLELAAAHKLKYILADADPGRTYVSSRFEQDAWAVGMNYATRPIATEVALFRLLREHIRIVCSHIPGSLQRSAIVGGGRTETAARLMKSMAGHANAHIRRIVEIRANRL